MHSLPTFWSCCSFCKSSTYIFCFFRLGGNSVLFKYIKHGMVVLIFGTGILARKIYELCVWPAVGYSWLIRLWLEFMLYGSCFLCDNISEMWWIFVILLWYMWMIRECDLIEICKYVMYTYKNKGDSQNLLAKRKINRIWDRFEISRATKTKRELV